MTTIAQPLQISPDMGENSPSPQTRVVSDCCILIMSQNFKILLSVQSGLQLFSRHGLLNRLNIPVFDWKMRLITDRKLEAPYDNLLCFQRAAKPCRESGVLHRIARRPIRFCDLESLLVLRNYSIGFGLAGAHLACPSGISRPRFIAHSSLSLRVVIVYISSLLADAIGQKLATCKCWRFL